MKKQSSILILVTLLAAVLVLVGQNIIKDNKRQQDQPQSIKTVNQSVTDKANTVTVLIDFGNGKKITGGVKAENSLQALEELAKQNNLSLTTKKFKYGTLVEKIGDTGGSNEYFWLYSLNGKAGQVAADRIGVNPGDTVSWQYSKVNK